MDKAFNGMSNSLTNSPKPFKGACKKTQTQELGVTILVAFQEEKHFSVV